MRKRKGFMLIVAYSVVAVLLILVAAYVARSVAEIRIAQRERDSLAALYAAESGVDYGLQWLRSQPSPPAGTATIVNPQIMGTPPPALTTGTYAIVIIPNPNNPTAYLKRYQIQATGLSGDSTRVVNFEVQVDSFARDVWFTSTETFSGARVWFITNDSLNGPVHTNGSFNIAGNPSFLDTTEQTGPAINYMHGGPPTDNPYFAKGIQFGVDPTSMPTQATNLRNAAANGGLVFTGNTTITLNSNGTINVTNSNGGFNNTNMPLPANGAIFVQNKISGKKIIEYGDINVSGTLNGRLSIGANDNVNIAGNIKYNSDPQVNPNSTDMLGIIAERDVIILQSAAPTNGNLTIQASTMAMANSFYLENWSSAMKGTLNVYGGIIQKERGPVGSFNINTNQKVSGFTKSYIYDPRLKASPPPFYPTTRDYIGLAWREL